MIHVTDAVKPHEFLGDGPPPKSNQITLFCSFVPRKETPALFVSATWILQREIGCEYPMRRSFEKRVKRLSSPFLLSTVVRSFFWCVKWVANLVPVKGDQGATWAHNQNSMPEQPGSYQKALEENKEAVKQSDLKRCPVTNISFRKSTILEEEVLTREKEKASRPQYYTRCHLHDGLLDQYMWSQMKASEEYFDKGTGSKLTSQQKIKWQVRQRQGRWSCDIHKFKCGPMVL